MSGKPFMLVSPDNRFVRMVESEEPIPVQKAVVMLTKALMTLLPHALEAGPDPTMKSSLLLPS